MNNEALGFPAVAELVTAKIVGLGGGGLGAVLHMSQTDLGALPCGALHTNARVLAGFTGPVVQLGGKLVRGIGTGGDPALGKAAAEESGAELSALFVQTKIVFLIVGLGGGTGTGAAPVVARLAKEAGALVVAFATLPFDFEGPRRARQAQAGLQQLKTAADAVICLPNQKLFKLLDEKTSIVEAFATTNQLLAQGVRGIWQMLTRPGLINVDFADLCAVLRGRHSESCFATAQAQGDNKSREVIEKLLANPLLDGGNDLAEADAILVSLVGAPDLSMMEINRVMEQINRRAENANIIMGAAVDHAFSGQIQVTLVAARRAARDAGERPEPSSTTGPELDTEFLNSVQMARPVSRFVAPPPPLTVETAEHLVKGRSSSRRQKNASLLLQGQLPLEIVSKGRFEKSEPTIHRGEDLDVPTYIRRGIPLN